MWGQVRFYNILKDNLALSFYKFENMEDRKGLIFPTCFTTEKYRAKGKLSNCLCGESVVSRHRGKWLLKWGGRISPKKRVLIEFVLKNYKPLYLLKANEALMLQTPSCLLYWTSPGRRSMVGLSHMPALSLEMVMFGSSSLSYWDMAWGFWGHLLTNNLKLSCESKKKVKKKPKRLFIELLKKKMNSSCSWPSSPLHISRPRGAPSMKR